jgi:hypothetical protein
MNLIARTKNSLEFNFISAVFFCLLFTQFFNNSTQLNNGAQLNIGIWQEKSDYNTISSNASTLTTKTIALGRITNASPLERIGTNLQNSFQEVAINTVASSASQSAINGDSFSDSLKAQGENVLIYTMAKVGANEIGRAYHGTTTLDANGNVIAKTPPTIGNLHAGLGAITSSLTKNDAMSGAIAGVAGELTAELANENGADVATSIQLANLAGAISSITYGGLTNQSDDQMANNAWEGSRIGGNAGANNAVLIGGKYKIPGSDSIKTSDEKDYDLHFGVQGTLTRVSANFGTDGFGLGADLNPSIGIGLYGNILPHGESASYSVITGFKNSSYGSGGLIITNQGNYGVTASWGASISFYPIPTNITASIPLENLKQK